MIFAGEAYNVEQGVADEVFPNERSAVAGCVFNPTPEDSTNIINPDNNTTSGSASAMSSEGREFRSVYAHVSAGHADHGIRFGGASGNRYSPRQDAHCAIRRLSLPPKSRRSQEWRM